MPDSADDAPPQFASPPCFLHELDPVYLGLAPTGDPLRSDVARRPKHDQPDLERPRHEPRKPR